jgi:hypothetical protein
MTTRKPLTEGNTRNVQKGNVAQRPSQLNVRPTAPPPAPTPPPAQQDTNNGGDSSSGEN